MHLRLRCWWRPAERFFFLANRRQPAVLGEGGMGRTMFMAMVVFAPSPSRLAKEKDPDQHTDPHQGKGAGHDKKIHPFWCHPAYGWQCVVHGIKIKSVLKNLPVESYGLSTGVLSPKSIFSRCIR
jgi:hypothetical protein